MSDGKLVPRQRKTGEENGGVPVSGVGTINNPMLPTLHSKLNDKIERESITLWRRPFTTLELFSRELILNLYKAAVKLWENRRAVFIFLITSIICIVLYHLEGPHQKFVEVIQKKILWSAYWIGLGVLSSVGLGTGLHTFLLYLGPHIAAVTLAAYECGSLNFPEPPYPDEIICPDSDGSKIAIGMFNLMSKVRLESFMWGVGTALGELPPYFMARAARLSGQDGVEELEESSDDGDEEKPLLQKAKTVIQKLVERVGFFGILLCASIPNPLFDLAGITCGHFLVPFWTFFGATVIGKAVIKMHIQMVFVIVAFNENHVNHLVQIIGHIPHFGSYLQVPFKEFFAKQKAKLHRRSGSPVFQESSWLAWMFEKVVIAMIVYFLLSIVNSMAQNHYKRLKRHRSDSHKVAED